MGEELRHRESAVRGAMVSVPEEHVYDTQAAGVQTPNPTSDLSSKTLLAAEQARGRGAVQSAAPLGAKAPVAHEGPLFVENELQQFQSRWDRVQASFVDEPRQAVHEADGLVEQMMERITNQFAKERKQLEERWDNGTNASTEELRQAFQRYRAFFGRLLAI